MTGLGAIGIVATIFTGLYPRVIVSHPTFANSLTISNAAAGHYALKVITVVAAIFTPIVLIYQGWTYYVFRKRLGGEPVPTPVTLFRGGDSIPSSRLAPVRALDPRLSDRTKSARPLLTLDAGLGIGTALAVLVQARPGGDRRPGVRRRPASRARPTFGLLLAAFVVPGRMRLGHGGRGAARRVERSCRSFAWRWSRSGSGGSRWRSTAPDSARDRRCRGTGDRGAGGVLRPLPAPGRAGLGRARLVVLAWVATLDVESALIMLITLPLVPVFMWLIGRYTKHRTEVLVVL